MHTDRHTYIHTYIQTDRQTDRQTDWGLVSHNYRLPALAPSQLHSVLMTANNRPKQVNKRSPSLLCTRPTHLPSPHGSFH